MPTPYEKIYNLFLSKLRSYEIASMDEDEVKAYMHDYLEIAINNFHVCRVDLADRNDEEETFNIELSNVEMEILSNYMVLAYVDATYIRTPTLLKVNLSSSDFNAFSNANQLTKLTEMQQRYLGENEAIVTRYAWLGSEDTKAFNALKTGYRSASKCGCH